MQCSPATAGNSCISTDMRGCLVLTVINIIIADEIWSNERRDRFVHNKRRVSCMCDFIVYQSERDAILCSTVRTNRRSVLYCASIYFSATMTKWRQGEWLTPPSSLQYRYTDIWGSWGGLFRDVQFASPTNTQYIHMRDTPLADERAAPAFDNCISILGFSVRTKFVSWCDVCPVVVRCCRLEEAHRFVCVLN